MLITRRCLLANTDIPDPQCATAAEISPAIHARPERNHLTPSPRFDTNISPLELNAKQQGRSNVGFVIVVSSVGALDGPTTS